MRRPAAVLLLLFATPAVAAAGPIEACRAAHRDDPAAHVRCLEDALRGATGPTAESGRAAPDGPDAPLPEAVPTGLGAEQVFKERQQRQAARGPVQVHIVSATYNARGLGTFRLADGQLWRETTVSPERHRLKPDTEYTGRIEPGRVVGYRLFVDGVNRMKTVERVE